MRKQELHSGIEKIRPAANHILTVGRGIIKDSYTAILELVKNSFDADAETVLVRVTKEAESVRIEIDDDGHGMSLEDIRTKWMVPSTESKLRQKRSKYKNRPLQGRKGIGRYSASILGDELLLKTTDRESLITTELFIDWREFSSDERFLDDVEILIECYIVDRPMPGTKLEIVGTHNWSVEELDSLRTTLKTLLSPFSEIEREFKIELIISGFENETYRHFQEDVTPFPVLDFFHYRVAGSVDFFRKDEKGRTIMLAQLCLENRHISNFEPVMIERKFHLKESESYCGKIQIDIRAYDLDGSMSGANFGFDSEEAKSQLRDLPGIAIIRSGFRVRPYGERATDWLDLNRRRYNSPTLRFSNNQVAGYVTVLQEEESNLVEKATREGFKENAFYEGLRHCVQECLIPLEDLRYKFRRERSKRPRKGPSLDEQLGTASSLDNLKSEIVRLMDSAGIVADLKNRVAKAIDQEAQEKRSQIEEINNTIARYQGQATLGRIMALVLHEVRKPLNAFKQHPKTVGAWIAQMTRLTEFDSAIQSSKMRELFEKIVDRLTDNKSHAEFISEVFKKLEPLARSKRPSPKMFKIVDSINASKRIFEHQLDELNVRFLIEGDMDASFNGWEIDFYYVFTNLIENSIHWMQETTSRRIDFLIRDEDDKVVLEYSDSGCGIDEENIEFVFDPGYSTKANGTGLGLSIVGEALSRNGGTIRAISTGGGARFVLELPRRG